MRTCVTSFVFLLALLSSVSVCADEIRPGFLQLIETEPDVYQVFWKVPALSEYQRLALFVEFDDSIEQLSEPVSGYVDGANVQQWLITGPPALTGTQIRISGIEDKSTEVLFRLELLSGVSIMNRFTPGSSEYVVEGIPTLGQTIWSYTVLGIEHILIGLDHLLFVLALLLLVNSTRKLITTITAFTVAHSITLSLAALDVVTIPIPPVEAVIALSIVFVACEIIYAREGRPGLTARKPWLVAFTFGLLHGLGFAAALGAIGLPQTAVPAALFFFNVGVEIGQLMFVAVMFSVIWLMRKLPVSLPAWSQKITPYAIGSMASFWVVERVAGFWV